MQRFLFSVSNLVLLSALIAMGGLWVVLRVMEGEREALRRYAVTVEQSLRVERLYGQGESIGRMVRSELIAPDPQAMAEIDAARAQFDQSLRDLLETSQAPREHALLEVLARTNRHLRAIAQELLVQRQRGVPLEQLLPRITGEYQSAREELDVRMAALLRYQHDALAQGRREAGQVVQGSVRAFLLGVPFAMAVLVAQAVLVVREVHRRRQAQATAERNAARHEASEARFSGIVSMATDAIISVDDAQRITIFNRGAEAVFGYGASEVLGQPLGMLLPERSREEHTRLIRRFAEGPVEARRMGEHRAIAGLRKGGAEFPAEAAISRVRVRGEHTLTVILRDVSRQRQVEREQRFLVRAGEILSSSLDYERTLSSVAQLAVQSLADWCIVYLWEGTEVRRTEVAHRSADMEGVAAALRRIPLDSLSSFFAHDVLERREPSLLSPVTPQRLAALARSAEHLALLERLAPRSFLSVPLVAEERLFGALVFISSNSERPYAREQLEFARELGRLASLGIENARLYQAAREATQARDVVLGLVAHDLRSPLSTITFSTQLLQRQLQGWRGAIGEQGVRALDTLVSSTRRMSRLIDDLLDVARMEAGRLSIRPTAQPTDALLREAVELARPQAGHLRLGLEEPAGLPAVLADRDRLLQVFSNLLGNALKFTPSGGEVRVGARVEGAYVCFSVRDTGPGLAPEALAHLFERFWQADRADRRGAGLGLSICKGIIEAHGGRISVESEPGRGTTFFFTVPTVSPVPAPGP